MMKTNEKDPELKQTKRKTVHDKEDARKTWGGMLHSKAVKGVEITRAANA